VSDTVVFLQEKYTMPKPASSDRTTEALEELTEALKNPALAKPFLNTCSKLNEGIASLTDLSAMNRPTTMTKGRFIVSLDLSGQRTTTKEPAKKRTTTLQVIGSPQMHGDPQLDHY
jgi:hypothetical protein